MRSFPPAHRSIVLAIFALGMLGPIGCRRPAGAQKGPDLPFDPPYKVDYPIFDGSVGDLVPKRVGDFQLDESAAAIVTAPALEAWSSFFKSADGRTIHLRTYRCANATDAFNQISGERAASVGVPEGAVKYEPAVSKGKTAGTLAKARYMNQVKGIEGDVVWCTRGNVAFVVSSSDGVLAETFWRELDKGLKY